MVASSMLRRTAVAAAIVLLVLAAAPVHGARVSGEPLVVVETLQVPDFVGPGQTGTVAFRVHVACPTTYVATDRGEMTYTLDLTGPAAATLSSDTEEAGTLDAPCNVADTRYTHDVWIDVTADNRTEAYASIQLTLLANHTDTARAARADAHIYTGRVGQLSAELLWDGAIVGEDLDASATVRVVNHYNTPLELRIVTPATPDKVRLLMPPGRVVAAAEDPAHPGIVHYRIDLASLPHVTDRYHEDIDLRLEAWEVYGVNPVYEQPTFTLAVDGVPDRDLHASSTESPGVGPVHIGLLLVVVAFVVGRRRS